MRDNRVSGAARERSPFAAERAILRIAHLRKSIGRDTPYPIVNRADCKSVSTLDYVASGFLKCLRDSWGIDRRRGGVFGGRMGKGSAGS